MKVPSIGMCSSLVPFAVSNFNLEGLHLVHVVLARVQIQLAGNGGVCWNS